MKKRYLAIFFALSLASACTFNVSTGSNSASAPASNTSSSSTPADNKTAAASPASNSATAPKKEAEADKKTESTSSSGNSVRVQFAKGETSTMLTKDIPANGSVDFLINAQKGQRMEYTVGYDFKDSDIEAFLTEPGLQDISLSSGPKEPQQFDVQKSGDHRLTVNNTTGKKVTITLYLDIN